MKLEDKIALITGGAMGIGKGIVRVFLKYGATVIILDNNNEELPKVINELNKEYPGKINGYIADITKEDILNACYNEVEKTYGRLDVIVNNAGVCKLIEFENMKKNEKDLHFNVNINGTWNVTRIFLPLLKKSNMGAVVNLSSVTGPMVADPGEVAYATSKAAILGFTKSLARELINYNIRVNAIMPGYVNTPMVNSMAGISNPTNPSAVITGIANAIPMKRLANPEEIGELAAFLGSNEASYITGQGIVIDGGSTLPETSTMGA